MTKPRYSQRRSCSASDAQKVSKGQAIEAVATAIAERESKFASLNETAVSFHRLQQRNATLEEQNLPTRQEFQRAIAGIKDDHATMQLSQKPQIDETKQEHQSQKARQAHANGEVLKTWIALEEDSLGTEE